MLPPESLFSWLGWRSRLDFGRARWIGHLFGNILFLLALGFVVSGVFLSIDFFILSSQAVFSRGDDHSALRNTGLALAAVFGTPFVIWRAYLAARDISIKDESLLNEKVELAAQSLNSQRQETQKSEGIEGSESHFNIWVDDLVGRVAAIDRLEGLAIEQPSISPRVARLLAAYIRGNFPVSDLTENEAPFTRKIPRMDLQGAVSALSRVAEIASSVDPSPWRLDLKACDFDGVDFQSGHFRAVDFSGSRFEAANFARANCEGCRFIGCLLNFCNFRESNLRGARFDHCILVKPQSGIFFGPFHGDVYGATFISSDISALQYLGGAEKIRNTFGTKDTKLSGDLRFNMPDNQRLQNAHILRSGADKEELTNEEELLLQEVAESGFENWSPYPTSDLATGWILKEFREKLEVDKWPFV